MDCVCGSLGVNYPGATPVTTFLKGSVMADVQVWTSAGPVDQIVRDAAKLAMPKLP
jgi:hypothetical protein